MLKYGVNMGLEISVLKTNANVNKVRLSGSIDNDTFGELKSSLDKVIATTSRAIVVDMADVKKVFEIMRLMPILNVFESQLELDDYLKRIQRRIQEDGGFTSV